MFDASLLVFVAIVALTAMTGIFFQPGAWYETLRKPSWTPPNWLFGPVWSVLYIMIAVAGWLVWRADGFGPAMWLWVSRRSCSTACGRSSSSASGAWTLRWSMSPACGW